MCFNTGVYYGNPIPEPKKATKDIWVWKMIGKDGKGWLHSLQNRNGKQVLWKRGWCYKELGEPFTFGCSYLDDDHTIKKGLHSRKRKRVEDCGGDDIWVEMYIPKGALYFENDTEYVSNAIVYP